MRPELIMKSIIPVVMAGIIAIYGVVVAVLIALQWICPPRSWTRSRPLWSRSRIRHWHCGRCRGSGYGPTASIVRRNDFDPYLRRGPWSLRIDRGYLPVHERPIGLVMLDLEDKKDYQQYRTLC